MNWIAISQDSVVTNGARLETSATGSKLLTALYRGRVNDYPKFFKMDTLCKLGFVASELLLQDEGRERFSPCEDRAVVLTGSTSSICADRRYQATIDPAANYFPSPSIFVYTLPNIVTGEIAIRNHYFGETSFYCVDAFSAAALADTAGTAFADGGTTSLLGGWLDCEDEDHFRALLFLAARTDVADRERFINQLSEITHSL